MHVFGRLRTSVTYFTNWLTLLPIHPLRGQQYPTSSGKLDVSFNTAQPDYLIFKPPGGRCQRPYSDFKYDTVRCENLQQRILESWIQACEGDVSVNLAIPHCATVVGSMPIDLSEGHCQSHK